MTPEERKAHERARYLAWASRPENVEKLRANARRHQAKKRAEDPEGAARRAREYREANPDKIKAIALRAYGILPEDLERMHEAQGGACAICADPIPLYGRTRQVDHCHTTGEIRGLLCSGCNKGLGQFRERPEALAGAIKYLAAPGTGRHIPVEKLARLHRPSGTTAKRARERVAR